MTKYDKDYRVIQPNYGGSRFRETYDGPIITDRVRREILNETYARYNEWRNSGNYR